MKRLSFVFFLLALLITGVAIAAVIVRANGLGVRTPIAVAGPAPTQESLTSN